MDDRGENLDFPRRPAAQRLGPAIPIFDLYGEPAPRIWLEPVHLEPLAARSARHGWHIQPHRHDGLHQVFWIRRGAGVLLGDVARPVFRAPALHLIPAGQVHGLRCDPASEGQILTLTHSFVAACGRLAGEAGFPDAMVSLLPGEAELVGTALDTAFAGLEAALQDFGGGRLAALAGHVLLLLSLLRRRAEEAGEVGVQASLLRRFRERIERRFREHDGLEEYCLALGVTRSTLARACRDVTGYPPMALIHGRMLAEARRMLVHGSRSVSGVAYDLGFDPAYFSRFFRRHEGVPPALYQRQRGGKQNRHPAELPP